MTDKEVMQMALDALESSRVFVTSREKIKHPEGTEWYDERIEALRARLAQPEPEPIAYLCENAVGHKYFRWKKPPSTYKPIALYTASPQRIWQGLTDDEKEDMLKGSKNAYDAIERIEAKLKEKNNGR